MHIQNDGKSLCEECNHLTFLQLQKSLQTSKFLHSLAVENQETHTLSICGWEAYVSHYKNIPFNIILHF